MTQEQPTGWTRHGAPIKGLGSYRDNNERPSIHRCGGTRMCLQCQKDMVHQLALVPEPGLDAETIQERTIDIAAGYVEYKAAQLERLGLTGIQLHKVRDQALETFNEWLEAIRAEARRDR